MRRSLLPWFQTGAIVLILVFSAGAAFGSVAEVERRIDAQDRLDPGADKARLLNDARQAVSSEDTATNRYLLGRAYGLTGQFEEAREQFDWAIERDPSFAYSYHGLGVYYMVKGNPAEAIRQFLTALRLDPGLNRAHADLGRIYLQQGEPLSAEQEFQKVLRSEPDQHEVRNLLAFMYLKEKRYDRAIQEFQVVLAKASGNLAARKGYALALSFAGRTKAAIREFETYLGKSTKDNEAYVFLARAYEKLGDKEGAIRTFERLKKVLPPDSPLKNEADQEIQRIREGRPASGGMTFEDLLARLDSDDVQVRRETMRTLCELDFYRLPKRMVQAVTDSDKVVRTLAVRKLGQVSPSESLPLLEILLLHPQDRDTAYEVRAAAIGGVSRAGTPAVVPILLAALDDPSDYVFRIAIQGLRSISGISFTGDFIEEPPVSLRADLVQKWREWWRGPRAFAVKLDAIDALAKLDFTRGHRYVAMLIADEDETVSVAAFKAFVLLTGRAPGTDSDLETPEGRELVRDNALRILDGK